MERIDIGTDSERLIVRVRIEGTYLGEPFVYEDPEHSRGSQYYWVNDSNDPSTYWWSFGNYACDCNRSAFLPTIFDRASIGCGHTIHINRIIPLEGDNLPILELNESE